MNEDVFPIEHGELENVMLVSRGVYDIVDWSSEAISCHFCTDECMWFTFFFEKFKWYIIEIKQKADIIRLVVFVILPGLETTCWGWLCKQRRCSCNTYRGCWVICESYTRAKHGSPKNHRNGKGKYHLPLKPPWLWGSESSLSQSLSLIF